MSASLFRKRNLILEISQPISIAGSKIQYSLRCNLLFTNDNEFPGAPTNGSGTLTPTPTFAVSHAFISTPTPAVANIEELL